METVTRPIMKYQYDSLVKELLLLQLHSQDPSCPCESEGEMCARKHLLTIEALSEETSTMEDDDDRKLMLNTMSTEAKELRAKEEKKLCGGEVYPFTERGELVDVAEWAREKRKLMEEYSLSCALEAGHGHQHQVGEINIAAQDEAEATYCVRWVVPNTGETRDNCFTSREDRDQFHDRLMKGIPEKELFPNSKSNRKLVPSLVISFERGNEPEATPDQVAEAVERADEKTVETGLEHGVVLDGSLEEIVGSRSRVHLGHHGVGTYHTHPRPDECAASPGDFRDANEHHRPYFCVGCPTNNPPERVCYHKHGNDWHKEETVSDQEEEIIMKHEPTLKEVREEVREDVERAVFEGIGRLSVLVGESDAVANLIATMNDIVNHIKLGHVGDVEYHREQAEVGAEAEDKRRISEIIISYSPIGGWCVSSFSLMGMSPMHRRYFATDKQALDYAEKRARKFGLKTIKVVSKEDKGYGSIRNVPGETIEVGAEQAETRFTSEAEAIALSEDEKSIPGFGGKLERCVVKVKEKQPACCITKSGKVSKRKGCYSPYAVCRASLRESEGLPVLTEKK